ncbi:Lsr2 family protein [Actinoplanes sp. NPDC026619]|uniref:histone-like nucleoid-structuring protein Lsr2 n=1 Tax=Actinoplanes sp. NPDC026619 TaxID=3155798 RepID=UPI0033D323E1
MDGVNYMIDLSAKNAGKLRKALDPYLNAGARVGRSPSGGIGRRSSVAAKARSTREENQAIREWTNKNGHPISGRGRVPEHIVEAYKKG